MEALDNPHDITEVEVPLSSAFGPGEFEGIDWSRQPDFDEEMPMMRSLSEAEKGRLTTFLMEEF